jgi:hypothetical protein
MGDAMSLLQNPDFENGDNPKPWRAVSEFETVKLEVGNDTHIARTGARYLKFRAAKMDSSVAQDIEVSIPSVTALGYVRADTIDVSGRLTIWDLAANPLKKIEFPFKVGQTWTQIVATLGRKTPGTKGLVRIELYLDTTDAFMFIDSVTAF